MALPLGVSTTMAALNLNMPRYFIHARLGERQLGIYSAMAYATVAMILVADSMGHCAIPRMSRLYAGGRLQEFRSLLLKLVAAGGALGLAGLAVAQFMGVPAAHSAVWPRVCGSLSNLPDADPGDGDSLRGVYAHQRNHVRAMLPDSGAAVCAGGGIERDCLRAMGAHSGAGGRRRGNGGGGSGASCAGRHHCGLAAARAAESRCVSAGRTGLRGRLGSEFMSRNTAL